MVLYVLIKKVQVEKQEVQGQFVSCSALHLLCEPDLKIPVAEYSCQLIDEAGPSRIEDFKLLDMTYQFFCVK